MQHKSVNMTRDYQKFPRHPVAAENFETRGSNSILSYYHYRVDPELGKGVCSIHQIPCACPVYSAQLDKYLLPTIATSSQPRYARVEIVNTKK